MFLFLLLLLLSPLSEIVLHTPFSEMHFLTQAFICISVLFWITRLIVVVYHVFQFWDIKCFYNTALRQDISKYRIQEFSWKHLKNMKTRFM